MRHCGRYTPQDPTLALVWVYTHRRESGVLQAGSSKGRTLMYQEQLANGDIRSDYVTYSESRS